MADLSTITISFSNARNCMVLISVYLAFIIVITKNTYIVRQLQRIKTTNCSIWQKCKLISIKAKLKSWVWSCFLRPKRDYIARSLCEREFHADERKKQCSQTFYIGAVSHISWHCTEMAAQFCTVFQVFGYVFCIHSMFWLVVWLSGNALASINVVALC